MYFQENKLFQHIQLQPTLLMNGVNNYLALVQTAARNQYV